MSLGLVSPLLNRGVRSRWLASLPGAGSKMLTIDSNGDTAFQDIPSASWGSITGTLSSQTDLQNALDAKLSLTGGTMTGTITSTIGTITASTPVLSATQTWNNAAVTFSAMTLNVTDTASASASLLLDLQVAGSSKFKVDKTGAIFGSGFSWSTAAGFAKLGNGAGDLIAYFNASGTQLNAQSFFINSSATNVEIEGSGRSLTFITGASYPFIEQRRGTTAQTFRLYGTYTDASNYRRLYLSSTTAGAFTLGVEGAGTGASGNTLTIGNQLLFGDGSASVPSISFSNDTDTGIYRQTNAINFAVNGVLRQQFQTDGSISMIGSGAWLIHTNFVLNSTGSGIINFKAANGSTDAVITAGATTLTPATLTGSSATSALDIAQTWNTTGTPTALKLNITDTASNAASLLLDLQVGGSSRFKVGKDGVLQLANSHEINAVSSANNLRLAPGGTSRFYFTTDDFFGMGTANDVVIGRDAANTLAQRNSTNAQTFRIYNTFTDASNYERGKIAWESNVLKIGTEKAGTGSARTLELQTDGTTRLTVESGGDVYVANNMAVGSGFSISPIGSGYQTVHIQGSNGGGFRIGSTTAGYAAGIMYSWQNYGVVFGTTNNFRLELVTNNTTRLTIGNSGLLTIADASDIAVGTTTGTKIGTATTQKIGFYNKTPVVQPAAVADATDAASVITQLNLLLSRMRDLGLIAT